MLNIADYIENIKQYVKDNFKPKTKVEDFIDDVLDLYKYKKSTIVFYDFDSFEFKELSNESKENELGFSITIVCRNDKSSNLLKKVQGLSSDFFNWFYDDRTFGGLCDFGTISKIEFFNGAENIKASSIEIKLNKEI